MNSVVNNLETTLIRWANPEALESRLPAKEDWMLHRLDHTLIVLLGYVIFILFGFLFLNNGEAHPFLPRDKRKAKLTVAEKWNKEPLIFLLMVIYNATQVLLCGHMVMAAIQGKKERKFGLVCNPHKLVLDKSSRRIASVLHLFYLTKVLDFADTIFMIIRGKWNQVTFLHVYHHITIYLIYWLILNAGYDGDIYFTVVLNGSIHFVMYFYYLTTTFNVAVPKPLKMMVTNMQLIQFVCMMTQALVLLFMGCPYPANLTKMYLVYIMSMFLLFSNFKRKTYGKKKVN